MIHKKTILIILLIISLLLFLTVHYLASIYYFSLIYWVYAIGDFCLITGVILQIISISLLIEEEVRK